MWACARTVICVPRSPLRGVLCDEGAGGAGTEARARTERPAGHLHSGGEAESVSNAEVC